jgi:alkanesulfonate monooxygenase SsuD/methylene tetrahydromethanopterin reductase-like flavin-dependent oxidoreductase (luciferase family)
VDISLILDNGRPWVEVRELAQAADELGAYAIYLCDHFMGHTDDDAVTDEGMLESMTLLAALAPLTSRSRLGPMVLGGTYHIWGSPEGSAGKSARLDEACTAIGRDPAEIRRATGFAYPVGTDIAEALEPYDAVCDEFVVFDWFDRPLQSTIDDLTSAVG